MKSLWGVVQLFIDSIKNLYLGGLAKGPDVAAPGHRSSRSPERMY